MYSPTVCLFPPLFLESMDSDRQSIPQTWQFCTLLCRLQELWKFCQPVSYGFHLNVEAHSHHNFKAGFAQSLVLLLATMNIDCSARPIIIIYKIAMCHFWYRELRGVGRCSSCSEWRSCCSSDDDEWRGLWSSSKVRSLNFSDFVECILLSSGRFVDSCCHFGTPGKQ